MNRFLVALPFLLTALACGTPSGTQATDVRAYLVRTRSWAPVEGETERAIERILATQFVDETEVRHQIGDIRPRLVAHLEQVRGYQPRTDAVARIHERYLAVWQPLLDGFAAIEAGFDTHDYTRLARGREAMEAWRQGLVGVAQDLRTLVQRLGVDPAAASES